MNNYKKAGRPKGKNKDTRLNIMISSDFSELLGMCDRILVLDGGRIIEDGTYEELVGQGGFFAELVARQQLENAS